MVGWIEGIIGGAAILLVPIFIYIYLEFSISHLFYFIYLLFRGKWGAVLDAVCDR